MSQGLDSWALDPGISRIVQSTSKLRSSVGLIYVAGLLLYLWSVATFLQLSEVTIVGSQVFAIHFLAKRRARVPRLVDEVTYNSRVLTELAQRMRVRKPSVKISRRSDTSVQVRGTPREPVILASPKTLLLWEQDATIHRVQLAHEMAHIQASDLQRLYFISTGTLLCTGEILVLLALGLEPNAGAKLSAIFTAAIFLALLSLRAFLRSREHAADFVAAEVLGSSARDSIPLVELKEGWSPKLFRTHPTPAERRRAFDNPNILFTDLSLPLFALSYIGFLTYYMTTTTAPTHAILQSKDFLLYVLLPMFAFLVSVPLGRFLTEAGSLAPARQRYNWLASFLFGTLLFPFLADPSRIVAVAAVLYLLLIGILVPLLSWGAKYVDGSMLTKPKKRLAQTVLLAAVWFGLNTALYHRFGELIIFEVLHAA